MLVSMCIYIVTMMTDTHVFCNTPISKYLTKESADYKIRSARYFIYDTHLNMHNVCSVHGPYLMKTDCLGLFYPTDVQF